MVDVQVLSEDRHRAAYELFVATVHHLPSGDDTWARIAPSYEPGRVLGAWSGDELVATASSMPSALRVPGGAELPMAAVTMVGVRADHTRRGLLSALMARQLGTSPEPVATLRASETAIYGRFGYGIASRGVRWTVDRARAGARNPGGVRVVDAGEAEKLFPELYRRFAPSRAGSIRRPEGWWSKVFSRQAGATEPHTNVVHHDPSGTEDAFARYHVEAGAGEHRTLNVHDVWAADATAYATVWRYLLSVDLVATVIADMRPADEPVELLAADPRAVRVTSSEDETWLRLVDVPAALAAREYGPATVVVGVDDPLLPHNSGSYRVGGKGAYRVSEEPEVRCDVATLATLYLGDRTPTELAAAGKLQADPGVLTRADSVFGTAQRPWCGTYF